MIRARLLVVLTAGAFVAVMAIPAVATVAPGGTEPELHLETDVLTPGRSVAIKGSGWPTGTTLQAVLCGANAVNGSVDCVQAAAVTMTPGPNGVVDGVLQVLPPPQPCPCVVVVSSLTTPKTITLPVQVVGMPTAPVPPAPAQHQQQPLIVRARVSGGNSLSSVFGGPAQRTLVLTVTNTGQSPVPNPVVSAGWGRKGNADHLITVPGVGPLARGEIRRISIPFELDALSFGSYTVAGRVTGTSAPVHFREESSTWPWGLFAILLIVVQLLLLSFRNALRRRIAAREARKRAAAQLEPEPEAASWEQVPADAEWTEVNGWTEDDESTADDDSVTADVDPVPAEISFPESPPPPADVASGPHDVGIGAPAPADPRAPPTETHWRTGPVDQPNGVGPGNGDRSEPPTPRGPSGTSQPSGARRGDRSDD